MNALEQALLERLKASEAKSVAFLQALLRAPSPNPPGDTRPAAALVLGAVFAAAGCGMSVLRLVATPPSGG